MQKILLMSALLLLAVGCSEKKEEAAKTAQSTASAKTTTVAKAPLEKEFVRSCVKQAEGNANISRANMEKICLCSLAGIKETYSLAQLQALDSASESEKMAFMKASMSAGMDCAVKFQKGQL